MKPEALSADAGPSSGVPHVVVGLTDSDPPAPFSEDVGPEISGEISGEISQETPSIEAKAPPQTTRSFVSTVIGIAPPVVTEEPALEGPPEDVVQAREAVPPPAPAKADFAKTIVHGSPEEPKPVEVVAEEPKAAPMAKTLVMGSQVDAAPVSLPEPKKDRLAEIRKDARERLRERRAQAQAAAAVAAPSTDPDEVSVPPASDIDVESERFFSEGDLSKHMTAPEIVAADLEELVPEKVRRKSEPAVMQRRAKLAGYVKIAVAGAAFVCLAALGSSAVRSHKPSAPVAANVVTPEPVPPPPPVETKAAEPAAAPAPVPVEEAKPAEPAAAPSASATEEAKPAEPAAAAPAATEEAKPAEPVTGDAKEELKKSRTALERRKIPESIEAGEKSVAIDPTNGEAWLILGAAYQEKGDLVNARRCYGSCVKEGKTGPVSECRKMLH